MMIYVGDYFIGHERVSLFADSEVSGGFFSFFAHDERAKLHPKDSRHGKIVIGFRDSNRWREVMEILEHEAYEYAFSRIGCRLRSDDMDNVDHAAYTFLATHTQFTLAVQMCSWFLCPALPDLAAIWRKHERKLRRSKSYKS